jgi:hypothetical protein
VPERLRVRLGGWLEIPVQTGDTTKSFFVPRGATAADLRPALWFERGGSARICDVTFSIGDRSLALTEALATAGISAARFVVACWGRPLDSRTAALMVRFPNGELLQRSVSVEAPLSLLRYGIADVRGLSFAEISFVNGGVPLPEDALQRPVGALGRALPAEFAVAGPLIDFSLEGLSRGAAVSGVSGVSALDRVFDLRRRVSADFSRSPFDFDFLFDGALLDDRMVLAQAGFGAQAAVAVVARSVPFARLHLSDLADKPMIVDVERPTETRWGDVARQISTEDPRTISFEFHGRPLERFHAVADPRNSDADPGPPFLSSPLDPINILMHEMEIRILPESGDEKWLAIPVTSQTRVNNLPKWLARHYPGRVQFTFLFNGRPLDRGSVVFSVNPDLIEPFFLRLDPPQRACTARSARDWSYTFKCNGSMRSLAIQQSSTVEAARTRWARELEAAVNEIEIRSGSRVLGDGDALNPWDTYEVKRVEQADARSGLARSAAAPVSGRGRGGPARSPQAKPVSDDLVEFVQDKSTYSYRRADVATRALLRIALRFGTNLALCVIAIP